MPFPLGDEPPLPEELVRLLEQLGGPNVVRQMRLAMSGRGGPVHWDLARQVAIQLAAEGDRPPTAEALLRAEEAQRLAEHWLDEGGLPAPAEAGALVVTNRQTWVNAALDGLRPLVEPVAAASVRALGELLTGQLGHLDVALSAHIGPLRALLEPMGGVLMGLQAGQVVGQLARRMLGQFDLGVPTADRTSAYRISVNVEEAFTGYDLDQTEVAIVLALHEGAHRRQYHALPWLASHLHGLVAGFADGMRIDADDVLEASREIMAGVDPEDPESLRAAMDRASQIRLEPTSEQRRVLERIQGLVCLLQAWARCEVRAAAAPRLPNLERIEEVLRRRRAEQGPGQRLLASLLGLDLKPQDETIGDRFVAAVYMSRGSEGLRRSFAHPENLPDAEELADPSRWLARLAEGEEVPDDPADLFGLGEAPVEPPAEERQLNEGGDASTS
ncbi:MAG: zinc-dependent metalloprotease [Actinomycetota bacterium]|nr:zinc-dependent metalloprotease [Actinomycetota bacterium]